MISIPSIATGLRKGRDGIWYGVRDAHLSYPENGHDACFAVEDKSFWFNHRNDCILSVLKSFPPGGTLFDIGGGNGFVSLALARAGFDVALVEPGPRGAKHARARGLETVICATTGSAAFKPSSFPAAGLFDVIEHVAEDVAFLKSVRRLIRKGGRLYMTVPAYPFLWSHEDRAAGHLRRYSLKDLRGAAAEAGFETEFSSYIFRFLPAPIALLRSLPFRLGLTRSAEARMREAHVGRDHAVRGGMMKKFSGFLFRSELGNLDAKKPMGFGGSCLVVAKNPES
jgi:SAM-dependent methyltransferase